MVKLESQLDPKRLLCIWRSLLKPDGRMLLGMNNRLGIRYFCGDRDPYTERNFDSVEGCRRAYVKKEDFFRGRMYSQAELKQMLRDAGWESARRIPYFWKRKACTGLLRIMVCFIVWQMRT